MDITVMNWIKRFICGLCGHGGITAKSSKLDFIGICKKCGAEVDCTPKGWRK